MKCLHNSFHSNRSVTEVEDSLQNRTIRMSIENNRKDETLTGNKHTNKSGTIDIQKRHYSVPSHVNIIVDAHYMYMYIHIMIHF